MQSKLDPYGLGRVVSPEGSLPQAADSLDPSLPIRRDELLVDVDHLNIDAASFRQISTAAEGDPARIAQSIQEIVGRRGKMHNPVTGSGGMLIGRVREIGEDHPATEVTDFQFAIVESSGYDESEDPRPVFISMTEPFDAAESLYSY